MYIIRPRKVVKVGTGLALILPASVCRDLEIHRGNYFDLVIGGEDILVAQRIKIRRDGEFGEGRDNSLPVIKHE